MKFYIGTKWENQERAKELAAILEGQGHSITCKWWEEEPFSLSAAVDSGGLPTVDHENAIKAAVRDIEGVRDADRVVIIMEKDLDYRGAWAEFGAALALDKPVLVIGQFHKRAVFAFHPNVTEVKWPEVG